MGINAIDAELAALMGRIRDVMHKMRSYAEGKYTVTNEISIFDKLLSFEEQRLSSHQSQRRVTVNQRSSQNAASYSQSQSGTSFSQSSTSRRHLSSGYSSPNNFH